MFLNKIVFFKNTTLLFQDMATSMIKSGVTVQKFVSDLNSLTKPGEKFACGYTR
jgi:hypothetical protein